MTVFSLEIGKSEIKFDLIVHRKTSF